MSLTDSKSCMNILSLNSSVIHNLKRNTDDYGHRRIAGGAWGCCSTPKLSEIFRLSEILGCRSEIFITYLYKNALLIIAKMF